MPQARDEAGNIWELDAQGNPVRLVQGAQPSSISPPDPRIAPTARKDIADANRAEAITPVDVAKTGAEATKAQNEASQSYPDRPTLTPDVYKEALDAYSSSRQLDAVIADLEKSYAAGPGSTKGVLGAEDFLNTPSMQNFNRSGDAGRGIILRAMGFAATQANTPNEVKQNIGAYIPSASDYDTTIQSKIDSLKALRDFTLQSSVRLLGGLPDGQGHIVPLNSIPPDQQPKSIKDGSPLWGGGQGTAPSGGSPGGQGGPTGSVWDQQFVAPNPLQAAQAGSTSTLDPLPPGYADAYTQYMATKTANGGYLDPKDYAQFRYGLDQRLTQNGAQDQRATYEAEAQKYNDYLKAQRAATGGQGGDFKVPAGVERALTPDQQRANNTVSNPLGAAIAGAADAGSFGGVQALAPDQFNALSTAHPGATLGGEFLGTIGGTSLIGGAGRAVAKRVAPALLKDAPLLNRLRQLGVDVTYGAAYGQNTQGDPLSGALSAGIGSVGGQGAGKLLGDVVGGVATSPAVQRLKQAGVNLTTGQTLGGLVKGAEDRMTSIPVIGDMVNARRTGGYQDFQRAAFNEGLAPIGATAGDIAERGVEQSRTAVSDAYKKALDGKTFMVDQPFHEAVSQRVDSLTKIPKVGMEAVYSVKDALLPHVSPDNTIPGTSFQNMRQDLLSTARKLDKNEASTGKAAGDEVRGLVSALDDMVQRQDPQAFEAYANANEAYRNSQIIRKAVSAGKNTEGVFTPAQLGASAERNASLYGGSDATTQRPFFQLQRDAQTTLPSKIPDSGTGGRLAQMGIAATLLGGGAGIGAATSSDPADGAQTGAGTALTLGALLALGGTRAGQRLLNAGLTERPAYMRQLGDIINANPRLFGATGSQLAIQSTR